MATNIAGGGGGSPRPEMVHLHTLSSGFVNASTHGLADDGSQVMFEMAQLNVTNLDTLPHDYTLSLLNPRGELLGVPSVKSGELSCYFWNGLNSTSPTQSTAQATISPGQTASLVFEGWNYFAFGFPGAGLRAVVTEITPVGALVSCLPTFEMMSAIGPRSELGSGFWNIFQFESRVVLEHFRETVTVEYILVSQPQPTPASTQTRISREQYDAYMKRGRRDAASNQRSAPGRSGRRPK